MPAEQEPEPITPDLGHEQIVESNKCPPGLRPHIRLPKDEQGEKGDAGEQDGGRSSER